MSFLTKKTVGFATALSVVASLALAGSHAKGEFANQMKARQGQFWTMALNLGVLGGMAKGEIEYDAAAAQAAADSILAVTQIRQTVQWPAESDEMSIEGTRAKPEIWDNMADFQAKWAALGVAAAGLQTAAAEGPAAIGSAVGQVGGACKACHDTYRAPQN